MCLLSRGKHLKCLPVEKRQQYVCVQYLADDILYWLQPYAQSLLWTTGIQQEHSLVPSLRGLDGLCKPRETDGGVIMQSSAEECSHHVDAQEGSPWTYQAGRCWTTNQTRPAAAASQWDRGRGWRGRRWRASWSEPAPVSQHCRGSGGPHGLQN